MHVYESRLLLEDPAGAAVARQVFGPKPACPLVPPGWADAQGLLAARTFAPRPQPVGVGSALAGLAAGSVLYVGPGGVLAQDAGNFNWDPINHRLGVGTAAPAYPLDVRSVVASQVTGAANSAFLICQNITDSSFFQMAGRGSTATGTFLSVTRAGAAEILMNPAAAGFGLLGTFNAVDFVFGANNSERLRLLSAGGVALFTDPFYCTADSSTSVRRTRADLTPSWADNTDATRKGRLVFGAWDTAARECLRIEASGTAAMVGFLGAAAVARPAVTGSRGGNAALASLLGALASLGLLTDGTTA